MSLTASGWHDPLLRAVLDDDGLTVTHHLWLQGDPAMSHDSPKSHADIEHRFGTHPIDDDQVAAIEHVRAQCAHVAHVLDTVLPPGREKSLALTHLEDSLMWGVAAIGRVVPPEPIANAHQPVVGDCRA